jgi:tRNA dimethylallyltransferase
MTTTNRRRIIRALEVTIGSGRPFSSFGDGLEAYVPSSFRFIGVDVERDDLRARIAARLAAMLEAGFLDEVRSLKDELSPTARQALGYKELLAHLDGELSIDDAVEMIRHRTNRLARRQLAWFRRDPRIEWRKNDQIAAEVLGDWKPCRKLSTQA